MHNLFPRVMRKVSIGKEEGVERMLEKEPDRKMVEDDFQKTVHDGNAAAEYHRQAAHGSCP